MKPRAPPDLPSVAELAPGAELAPPLRIELGDPVAVAATAAVAERGLHPGAREVECVRVLRGLPGRRLAAEARLAGVRVLCKVYFGRGAARHADREAAGSRRLVGAGVATPRLLGHWTLAGARGRVLLFEWLDSVRPLAEGDTDGLALAAAGLARLHAAGLRHADPHLGNLLADGRSTDRPVVHFVDTDGVRAAAWPGLRGGALGPAASRADLALLCAQRGPSFDGELDAIRCAYLAARGGDFELPLDDLQRAVNRVRVRRARRYLRKTTRACSEFGLSRRGGTTCLYVREQLTAPLQRVLHDPEAAMAGGALLKDGNSATVVRVTAGARRWVIKRYNVKNLWHGLRRSLRPLARHRNAWRNGQLLHFLGLPTARPVALVERRVGPFRGRAYLVMEDLGDQDLLSVGRRAPVDPQVIEQVVTILAALRGLGIAHGDTKASNFLLARNAATEARRTGDQVRVALIDLDAMGFRPRGCARDVERFLANWQQQPELAARFRAALLGAGLLPR